jgi:hypothetical protein
LGRRAWSDDEVLKLSREFVCVADEVWQLDHFDDEGSKFFREYFKLVPKSIWDGGRETTKQGTYLMTPEGEYLAGHFGRCSREDTLGLMKEALKKWNERVAQKGLKPKPVPDRAAAKTWDATGIASKAGGKLGEKAALILQVNSRDLPGSTINKEYVYAWNQTWLEFTADEARSFLPKDGKKGSVPETLLRKLARDSLVDNVRGQTDGYADDQMKTLTLDTETLSMKGNLVTVRLSGAFNLDAGQRGFEGRMHGQAIFDTTTNAFRKFELAATGIRRGATQFNFRRMESPSPLGVCFTIEGQYDQAIPADFSKTDATKAKSAAPVRKEPSAAALAAWDARMFERLQATLAAGTNPEFHLAAMKMKVKVARTDEKGNLSLTGGGASMAWEFKRLAAADKQALALALARPNESDDCAMVAFYLLANGSDQQAQEFLKCAGQQRQEILALFK